MQEIKIAQSEEQILSGRILLVEDHEVNRNLLSDYLTYLGYQVFSLAEGSTFFETISCFQPHLVLLDLKLPGIDGYTLLEQMQQGLHYHTMSVFVISAYAFKADQQKAFRLGAKKYFVKPVNLSQLRLAIQEELRDFSI